VKWLLCDYGEVLCLAPPAADWRLLVAAADWDSEAGDFGAAYWASRVAYDRGDLTVGEYWEKVLGRPLAPGQLDRLIERDIAIWLHPNQASVAAAVAAKDRGFRLAILSNAPYEVAAAIDRAQWLDAFERRFFSCRLRSVKPEPAAYTSALAALGADAHDVLFFDDRPANVAGAEAIGIRAVLFEDPSQFDLIGEGTLA
jgi:putative hydrolase of the HAD superfamily